MLELAILGFLASGPLHGYELRRRIVGLLGHARPVSDGSLYPALDRLVARGLLIRRVEAGTAARRQVVSLTRKGRQDLLRRLREPAEVEITDLTRWLVVLAFLSELPERADRDAVLARRQAFVAAPESFFSDEGRLLRAAEVGDPYRRGMFVIARAANRAERAWLQEMLAGSMAGSDQGSR